ncbi:glycosyl hydrolase catalytic core-domain-containing protein [Bisporella sp. PMI_857]|nr:glycosyl hydrolase catalytic core-domain-containing protein [Bisporella sp. PMI_857]
MLLKTIYWQTFSMVSIRKRALLWDWTNTAHNPDSIESINFDGLSSCSNWNAWEPPELKRRLPFRPTIRSIIQITNPDEWNMISNSDHTIVHYFNEPERAGISPEKAAEIWNEKVVPLRKENGKKIIGPGCASDTIGEKWLEDFMEMVKNAGEPPDYLSLHYYGPDGTAAISYIKKMHNKYPDFPVVVSEIASNSRDKKDVFAFTAQLANWMDECPWIFEYSFFGCMKEVADDFVSPAAQLMDKDGRMTDLMKKLMHEQPMSGIYWI